MAGAFWFVIWRWHAYVQAHIALRGAGPASVEQLEDLVDVSVSESDRYYPAFQFVIWGGKTATEALNAALIDVAGEA